MNDSYLSNKSHGRVDAVRVDVLADFIEQKPTLNQLTDGLSDSFLYANLQQIVSYKR